MPRTDPITRFAGKYLPFSAFWEGGLLLPTLEHHFHACKTYDLEEQDSVMCQGTPREAKAAGQNVTMRQEWDDPDQEARLRVMYGLNVIKFSQPELQDLLLSTGRRDLLHGNAHRDKFWGVVSHSGVWVGENYLGRMLMMIREQLRSEWMF